MGFSGHLNNCINEHLKKPKWLLKFSVNCPIPKCEYTPHTTKEYDLKVSLLHHVFDTYQHQYEPITWSEESLAKYVDQNYTSELVPNPNFLSMHSNYVC